MIKIKTPQAVLTGTQFESLVKARCDQLRLLKLASIVRYGVQASRRATDWVIHQSLPDFEGVTRDGRQTVFDAKVCSQASFNLEKYRKSTDGARARQLTHMYERSEYRVRCFMLIHWNARQTKTKAYPAVTYAFPVRIGHPFWESFEAGEAKAIRRMDCESYGFEIPWTLASQMDRTPRPDVMAAVTQTPGSVEIAKGV